MHIHVQYWIPSDSFYKRFLFPAPIKGQELLVINVSTTANANTHSVLQAFCSNMCPMAAAMFKAFIESRHCPAFIPAMLVGGTLEVCTVHYRYKGHPIAPHSMFPISIYAILRTNSTGTTRIPWSSHRIPTSHGPCFVALVTGRHRPGFIYHYCDTIK